MAVQWTLPDSSMFLPTANIFEATYNTPTLGFYDFGKAANSLQAVQGISPGFLYFIGLMNFGASMGEPVYLENISTIPRVQFYTKRSGKSLYGGGYPLTKYLPGNDVSAFAWTSEKDDEISATFTGILSQNASLSGVPSIRAQVSLNIYQIMDRAFIKKFFNLAGDVANPAEGNIIALPPGWERRI